MQIEMESSKVRYKAGEIIQSENQRQSWQSVSKMTGVRACFSLLLLLSCSTIALPQTIYYKSEHQHHDHNRTKIDEVERDRWMWQLPERVLDSIGVVTGMVVADVGAGEGYFTIRLAQRVGNNGVVYANEITGSYLHGIQNRCVSKGVANVKTVLGSPDDPNLPNSQMDIVLMVNVIHLVENKTLFLQNVRNSIKPGGVLSIVQWEASKLMAEAPRSEGPPDLDEYDRENLLELLDESGYDVDKMFTFLPLQDILMCYPRSVE